MVNRRISTDGSDDYFEQLQASWPEERPSRKRKRRAYKRKEERRVVVTAKRLEHTEPERMSRALLAAQRELAQAQAEKEAQAGRSAQEKS